MNHMPDGLKHRVLLAAQLSMAGKHNQSVKECLEICKDFPRELSAYFALAEALRAAGLSEKAGALERDLRRLSGHAVSEPSWLAIQPPLPPPPMPSGNIPKYVPDGHFYSPLVDPVFGLRWEDRLTARRQSMPGVEFSDANHLRFLNHIAPRFIGEYDYPLARPKDWNGRQFFEENRNFIGVDARALYVMLRHLRPRRMIEVGSGFTTMLSTDVNVRFLQSTCEICCIEPYRDEFGFEQLPGLRKRVKALVQDVPVSFFQQLGSNDILFIDSSHVVKTCSDVNYLMLEVLPQLQIGVVVHIHDIFLPSHYPRSWVIERGFHWNEQYLVQALLQGSNTFEVLFGSHYAWEFHTQALETALGKTPECGSLWLRKLR
jgi:hypothetical protein